MRLKQKQVMVRPQHRRELSAQDLEAGVCWDEDVLLGRTGELGMRQRFLETICGGSEAAFGMVKD